MERHFDRPSLHLNIRDNRLHIPWGRFLALLLSVPSLPFENWSRIESLRAHGWHHIPARIHRKFNTEDMLEQHILRASVVI
jgi:hypothetical protein